MTGNVDEKTCEAARAWLVRLASGHMTAGELAAFKAWLNRSEAHASAFRHERAFWRRLSQIEPAFDRLAQSGAARSPEWRRPGWRKAVPLAALAAAACLLLIVLHPMIATALLTDYRSGRSGVMTVRLADDSRVTLNRNSAIRVRFGAAGRDVDLLQGEAFFEVHPDRQRPFRVLTGSGASEAVGTAYAVRRADDGVRVAVTQGEVAVTATAQPGTTAVLRAGEGVRYGAAGLLGNAFALDGENVLAWRQGKVIFVNRPLADALAELEQYHPGRILLLGGAGAHQPISGIIDLDRLKDGIAALAATHGLSVVEVTPFLTILR
jgi:transmembrane sensor